MPSLPPQFWVSPHPAHIKSSLCYLYVLGCGAFHWSMVNLTGATLLKKTASASLSSFQLLIARGEASCPNPHSMLWFGLVWVCVGFVSAVATAMSSCVFSCCAVSKRYSFLIHKSIASDSYIFSIPLPRWFLRLGRREASFRAEHPTVSYLYILMRISFSWFLPPQYSDCTTSRKPTLTIGDTLTWVLGSLLAPVQKWSLGTMASSSSCSIFGHFLRFCLKIKFLLDKCAQWLGL